jgi:cytochrome P450
MNYQHGPNPLADSLRSMISWTSFGNFFIRHNPTRPLIMRYYGRIMNDYIRKAMTKRWTQYKSAKNSSDGAQKPSKSAISLALESYFSRLGEKRLNDAELDERFAAYAQYQIRLFLFAGHDTTTGSLVYTYHMLAKHPKVLRRVQEEHTSVFGPDARAAGDRLRENPSLLNQLPYTLAVIKETMRIYAPSGAVRDGVPGRFLTDRHGTSYPTEGIHISIMHQAIHDNPRLWPRVREFLPERWLVPPGDPLYPPHGAWRVFEVGPRNCIGQTLALVELRLTLVMTLRTFSVKPAYEEWDLVKPKGLFYRLFGGVGLAEKRVSTVDGDRAYPIERGGAHPKDMYPCKVEVL